MIFQSWIFYFLWTIWEFSRVLTTFNLFKKFDSIYSFWKWGLPNIYERNFYTSEKILYPFKHLSFFCLIYSRLCKSSNFHGKKSTLERKKANSNLTWTDSLIEVFKTTINEKKISYLFYFVVINHSTNEWLNLNFVFIKKNLNQELHSLHFCVYRLILKEQDDLVG